MPKENRNSYIKRGDGAQETNDLLRQLLTEQHIETQVLRDLLSALTPQPATLPQREAQTASTGGRVVSKKAS